MTSAVGIDLGTRKIAFSTFRNGHLANTDSWVAPERMSRDEQLHNIGSYARDYVNQSGCLGVWIESIIIGNNRKYSLMLAQTYGAVAAAIHPVLVEKQIYLGNVDNKRWKKELLGNGNSTKDMIKNWLQENYPAYAEACLGDQDRYDATCVALYGLTITGRADGLKLA